MTQEEKLQCEKIINREGKKRLTTKEKLLMLEYEKEKLKEDLRKEEAKVLTRALIRINKYNRHSIEKFLGQELKENKIDEIILLQRGLLVFLDKNKDLIDEIKELGRNEYSTNSKGELILVKIKEQNNELFSDTREENN